jgi:hypothetical protein
MGRTNQRALMLPPSGVATTKASSRRPRMLSQSLNRRSLRHPQTLIPPPPPALHDQRLPTLPTKHQYKFRRSQPRRLLANSTRHPTMASLQLHSSVLSRQRLRALPTSLKEVTPRLMTCPPTWSPRPSPGSDKAPSSSFLPPQRSRLLPTGVQACRLRLRPPEPRRPPDWLQRPRHHPCEVRMASSRTFR